MSPPPSRPPRHPIRSPYRHRAVLVAAAGIVLSALGVARVLGAGASGSRADDLVWWGAGVLLLAGPAASSLAVVLVLRGQRADVDLRLRDLDRHWHDPGSADPWRPGAPHAIDVAGTPGPPGRAAVHRCAAATLHRSEAAPAPGEIHRAAVDALVVLDVSTSMDRADPAGHRFRAAAQLVELLAATGGGDRVGVVLFAGRAMTRLPLTRLAPPDQRRLVDDALERRRGAGTSITAGLVEAADRLTLRPDALPAVLLFTDGRSAEPVEHLVLAARRIPHGSLHVLHHGDLPPRWDHVPTASRLRIGPPPASTGALARHLAHVLQLGLR